MQNFILEGKKIARPVLVTLCLLTLLACILSCTLYREYTIHFELDPWEIGTEFLSLLFPLFVTVPICWQLYYERRDRFSPTPCPASASAAIWPSSGVRVRYRHSS